VSGLRGIWTALMTGEKDESRSRAASFFRPLGACRFAAGFSRGGLRIRRKENSEHPVHSGRKSTKHNPSNQEDFHPQLAVQLDLNSRRT